MDTKQTKKHDISWFHAKAAVAYFNAAQTAKGKDRLRLLEQASQAFDLYQEAEGK